MLLELPIPYETYFAKVTKSTVKSPSNVFLKDRYLILRSIQKQKIVVIPNIELNDFYTNLDLKGGDIMGINDKSYSLDNIYDMIGESQS
jgi:hypothetical protein